MEQRSNQSKTTWKKTKTNVNIKPEQNERNEQGGWTDKQTVGKNEHTHIHTFNKHVKTMKNGCHENWQISRKIQHLRS